MANQVTKRVVIVRTTFDAVHQWKDAPRDQHRLASILSYPHRHKFYVEVEVIVEHPDRAIEFLECKRTLDQICNRHFGVPGSMEYEPLPYSCETMAEMIGKSLLAMDRRFHLSPSFTVAVFEDNENGGKVQFT